MKNTIFIIGTARGGKKTHEMADEVISGRDIPVVDLNDIEMSHYDYEHENKGDDFIPLMKRIIENHDTIVLATPVYWYSVSSVLKVFLDRITDLLTIEKDLGRKLRGKKLYMLVSGGYLPEYFESPIADTCKYLGMEYLGSSFICSIQDAQAQNNDSEIAKAKKILFEDA